MLMIAVQLASSSVNMSPTPAPPPHPVRGTLTLWTMQAQNKDAALILYISKIRWLKSTVQLLLSLILESIPGTDWGAIVVPLLCILNSRVKKKKILQEAHLSGINCWKASPRLREYVTLDVHILFCWTIKMMVYVVICFYINGGMLKWCSDSKQNNFITVDLMFGFDVWNRMNFCFNLRWQMKKDVTSYLNHFIWKSSLFKGTKIPCLPDIIYILHLCIQSSRQKFYNSGRLAEISCSQRKFTKENTELPGDNSYHKTYAFLVLVWRPVFI